MIPHECVHFPPRMLFFDSSLLLLLPTLDIYSLPLWVCTKWNLWKFVFSVVILKCKCVAKAKKISEWGSKVSKEWLAWWGRSRLILYAIHRIYRKILWSLLMSWSLPINFHERLRSGRKKREKRKMTRRNVTKGNR